MTGYLPNRGATTSILVVSGLLLLITASGICDWRRILPECMSNPCSQRDFIDIAVTLPDSCKKRLMTEPAIEAVITLFPSIRILRTLASHNSPDTIATLLCAALAYVQNKQYDTADLTTLLPALWKSRLTLPSSAPKAQVHHTFMNRESCNGGITIHSPADVADGETGLDLFVATITDIASDMLSTFASEHFTVEQYGLVLPANTVEIWRSRLTQARQ